MATHEKDMELLSEALKQLLQGELKVGANLLSIGSALKRQGKNTEWKLKGVVRYLDEHGEVALPLLGGALAHHGIDKFLRWAREKYPEEFAQAAEAEVQDGKPD